jgi:putative ABC transport system permease protein
MRIWALRQLRRSAGQYAASAAVVAVVSAFAVLLIEAIDALQRAAASAGIDDGGIGVALGAVGVVFLGVAVLTAGVVVTNTFTTVYAGRLREIALLRLVGATSRQVRRTALLDGAVVGVVGAVVGILAGSAIAAGGIALLNRGLGAGLSFGVPVALWAGPLVAGALATTLAAHAAARGVSRTSPAAAIGAAATAAQPTRLAIRVRTGLGLGSFTAGAAVLALGCALGLVTPLGVLVGFAGGVLSIVGVIVAAPSLLLPPIRWVAALLPRTPAVRLAAANLLQEPLRTARTVLAVTVGVALITMFVVAGTMWSTYLHGALDGQEGTDGLLTGLLTGVAVLTSFSILVAAIGVASTLSLSVLQRRREIGMLRAAGMTRRQVRRMLLAEALLTTGAGAVAGLVLGVAYGFAGYTSTLASARVLPPEVPPAFVPVVLLGALAFGAVASLAPGRRAGSVPPAEALQAL